MKIVKVGNKYKIMNGDICHGEFNEWVEAVVHLRGLGLEYQTYLKVFMAINALLIEYPLFDIEEIKGWIDEIADILKERRKK